MVVRRRPQRADWLADRAPYIGASEIGALLGLSPWRTPAGLWLEKTGRAAPAPASVAMEIGNALEPLAARLYARETGRIVRNYGYMLIDESAHICADVDRLICKAGETRAAYRAEIRAAGVLECKTGAAWSGDEIPAHYAAQVQTYCALTGLPIADVAAIFLAPRREFRIFNVPANPELWKKIRALVAAWYQRHIVGDTPPQPVCEADCRALWQSSHGRAVIAAAPELDALDAIRRAETEIGLAEKRADAARAVVMASMKDADEITDAAGAVLASWKQGKPRAVVDWRAVADEFSAGMPADERAAVIAAHTTTRPGARAFRLAKKNKENEP